MISFRLYTFLINFFVSTKRDYNFTKLHIRFSLIFSLFSLFSFSFGNYRTNFLLIRKFVDVNLMLIFLGILKFSSILYVVES